MIKHDLGELSDNSAVKSGIRFVLGGTVASYIFLIAAFAILAVVYTYTPLPAGLISPLTSAVTAVSIIFCGAFCARKAKCFGWLHGGASGMVYSIIRIAVVICVKSHISPKDALFVLATGIFLGIAGGIIGINLRKNS